MENAVSIIYTGFSPDFGILRYDGLAFILTGHSEQRQTGFQKAESVHTQTFAENMLCQYCFHKNKTKIGSYGSNVLL